MKNGEAHVAMLFCVSITLGEETFNSIKQNGVVIGFAQEGTLFAKVTCLLSDMLGAAGENDLGSQAVFSNPARQAEAVELPRTCHLTKDDVDLNTAVTQYLDGFVCVGRLEDSISALTKIPRKRLANDQVGFNDQDALLGATSHSADLFPSTIAINRAAVSATG